MKTIWTHNDTVGLLQSIHSVNSIFLGINERYRAGNRITRKRMDGIKSLIRSKQNTSVLTHRKMTHTTRAPSFADET